MYEYYRIVEYGCVAINNNFTLVSGIPQANYKPQVFLNKMTDETLKSFKSSSILETKRKRKIAKFVLKQTTKY